MGFTALDGLMMGTRSGAIDPGVLLYLLDEQRMSSRELAHLLYQESGLLGVSGLSHDMRILLVSSEPRARLAVGLFVHRVTREIGSLAAAAPVRAAVCEASRWLGIDLDGRANVAHGPVISTPQSRVAVAILSANEEEIIERHTIAVSERVAA